MGRHKKASIQGIMITINGNSVYIDFSSKNKDKMNDIVNQIHMSINAPKPQESDNTLIDSCNINSIECNQGEDMLQIDNFTSDNGFFIDSNSDYFTSDDNGFFDDSNSDYF